MSVTGASELVRYSVPLVEFCVAQFSVSFQVDGPELPTRARPVPRNLGTYLMGWVRARCRSLGTVRSRRYPLKSSHSSSSNGRKIQGGSGTHPRATNAE